MSTIRSLLAKKLISRFRSRPTGTIVRTWNVERLEDRLNPAPTPVIGGLPGAGTLKPLIGESTSIAFTYTNTGDQTGYSPFLDVGVDTTGADGLGAAVDDGIVAAPTISGVSGTLTPVGSIVITGPTYNNTFTGETNVAVPVGLGVGDTIYVYRLPFGSFTPTQTTNLTLNLASSNLADQNVALPFSLRPVFRDGTSATGGLPIAGTASNSDITPNLFTLKKTYLGPEDETATGPNYKQRYRLDVDIATGQTISNLQIRDLLANSMQWTGAGNVIQTVHGAAVGTSVGTSTATTTAPGGTIIGNFGNVTGVAGDDASLNFEFFVPRDFTDGTEILPQPTPPLPNPAGGTDSILQNNTGSANGTWTPIDTRDPANQAVSRTLAPDAHVLQEQSVAVQKTVTPVTKLNAPTGGSIVPGTTLLRYDVDFEVSDYYAVNNLFLNDVLGDGQRLYLAAGFGPTLSVDNAWTYTAGGTRAATNSGAFAGANTIGFTRNYSILGSTNSDPSTYGAAPAGAPFQDNGTGTINGTTALRFNISQELIARGLSGILVGGEVPNGGGNPSNANPAPFGAARGRITFWVEVKESFSDDFPSGNRLVNQGDILRNAVPLIQGDHLATTDLSDGTPTDLGTKGTDDTAASVVIPRGIQSKDLYAVNGSTVNLGALTAVQVGDRVTYRLRYTLPISSFEDLKFTDFPPLPVFPVPPGTSFNFNSTTTPTFAPYEIAFGPSEVAGGTAGYFETFPGQLLTPVNVATVAALGAAYNPTGGPASNGQFSGAPLVVDGVTLVNGSRILVKNQAIAAQNGVYVVVSAGNWNRATDFDSIAEADTGILVRVLAGTVNSGNAFIQTNKSFNTFNGAGAVGDISFASFITTDPTTNSITLNFGSFQNVITRTSTTVDILVTLVVADFPFVSDLSLTNQFQVSEGSTNNGSQTLEAIRQFELVRPAVTINKGVVGINGTGSNLGGIIFTAPTAGSNFSGGPIDTAAEATAIGAPNAINRDAGEEVRFAVVAQNTGRGDAYDLVIEDTIPPEYDAPITAAGFLSGVQGVLRRGDGTQLSDARLVNQIVRVASTADVGGTFAGSTITGATGTVDTIALSVGDFVLLKNQTNPSQNGVYLVTAITGAAAETVTLTLATDLNGNPASDGHKVAVLGGLTNADLRFTVPLASTVYTADVAPITENTFYYSYNPTTHRYQINLPDNLTSLNTTATTADDHTGALSRGFSGTAASLVNVVNGGNTVVFTYDVVINNTASPNQTIMNTAIVRNYGTSQGGGDLTNPAFVPGATEPVNSATVTVTTVGIIKTLDSTEFTAPGNNGPDQATIGEIITYTVTMTIPEATAYQARLVDTLDAGLAFVDITSVTTSAALTFANGIPSLANTIVTSAGQVITFNFGTVVNSDTNNANPETISITYRVVVLNTIGNQANGLRNNSAAFQWATSESAPSRTQNSTASANNVTIVEPTLSTLKQVRNVTQGGVFSGSTGGDNSDTLEYQIGITNGNLASDTTAYDIVVSDPLPPTTLFQPGAGQLQITSITATGGGTITVTGGTLANAFVILGNTVQVAAGFNIDMTKDTKITITLSGVFTGAAGVIVPNTVDVRWTSLDGSPGAKSTYNTASTERGGADGVLNGGTLNDYRVTSTALIDSPPLVRKTIISTSEPSTLPNPIAAPGVTTGVNVAIGEVVRYRIYVSVGEGVTPNFQIQDNLPVGLRFLNDGTARYTFISTGGADIASTSITDITGLGTAGILGTGTTLATLASSSVAGTFNDDNIFTAATGPGTGDAAIYASGQGVFFRFGNLNNTDNDVDNEFVVVEFNALVENILSNQSGINRANTFNLLIDNNNDGTPGYVSVVQDNDGSGTGSAGDTTVAANDPNNNGTGTKALSNTATVTIVEPAVTLAKTVRNETNNAGGLFTESVVADAGDVLTFQLVLANTGNADAFNIAILDALPSGVTYVAGSLVQVATGTVLTSFSFTGNTLNATFDGTALDGFDNGETIILQFRATVVGAVTPNQNNANTTNTASVTWTSLPGAGATTPGASGTATGERTGDDGIGGLNDYATSDPANFIVPVASFTKTFFATDLASTPGSNVGIGETVTYALLVTLPEGTTPAGMTFRDNLPAGMTYSSFTLVTTATGSGGLLAADFSGTVVDPIVSGGPFATGVDPIFTFGAISTTGDNVTNNNSFLILVKAIVLNVPGNVGIGATPTTLANTATFDIPGDGVPAATSPPVTVTVVEPRLQIVKTIVGGDATRDALDEITFQLVIGHTASSTAAAFDLAIQDLIPAGMQMVTSSAIITAQPGYAGGVITTNGPSLLINASELRLGDTITITYKAFLVGPPTGGAIAPSGTVTNTATVDADTFPGANLEQRAIPQASDTKIVTVQTNSIGGNIWNDSNNDGLFNGAEVLIAGQPITVVLSGTDHLGNLVDVTQTTSTGTYNFTGLRPGVYTVTEFNQPTGFLDGRDTPGTSTPGVAFGGTGTAATTPRNLRDGDAIGGITIGLGDDKAGINYNFGEILPAALGNFVWEDTNGNGRQDIGELGLVGVIVTLAGTDDSGQAVTLTATTVAGGAYSFNNLRPTDATGYVLTFATPTGYARTIQNSAVATSATDSNGNVTTGQTAGVVLVPNQTDNTIDQGMYRPVTIGDTVFYDTNADGTQNGTASLPEPGIPGAIVRLYYSGADGVFQAGELTTAVATATTDANGTYSFPGLIPGLYRVILDPASLPEGTSQITTPVSQDSTTTSGVDDPNRDFGARGIGTLGDTIFFDQNANGVPDAGEGLNGVVVRLTGDLNGDGTPETLTATTNGNGLYQFTNLRTTAAGLPYTVTVDTTTLPSSVTNTVDPDTAGTGNNTSSTALTTAAPSNQLQDFGYRGVGQIGDTIFLDQNGDGTAQSAELLAGVVVTLTADVDGNGTFATFTATTDASGQYLFSGLPTTNPAGTNIVYTVTIVGSSLPTLVTNTIDPDGGFDSTSKVTLTPGAPINLAQDFAYRGVGQIGDTIFLDLDNDGLPTPGEGIANVTVLLIGDIDANGTANTFTTTTDGDGNYLFSNLPTTDKNGVNIKYTVRVVTATLPATVTNTVDPDGGFDSESTVTLNVEFIQDLNQDFGYRGNGSLGDRIWLDANGNGLQDALATEPGLAGIEVTLVFAGQDGVFDSPDDIFTTTTTGADGSYLFTGLPAGKYLILVNRNTLTSNLTETYDLDGISTSNRAARTLADGEAATDVDFGYRGAASVGDLVWLDRNADGTRNPGESAIPGAVVVLRWAGTDGTIDTADDLTFTTTTDANGAYLFQGLPVDALFEGSDDYRTTVTLPIPGIVQVFDPDGTLDNTSNLTLAASQNRLDQDYGYRGTGSLAGTVYRDDNNDGILGAAEVRIPGVLITLTGVDVLGNPVSLTTTTDSSGNYSFGFLVPGTYNVTETQPTQFADGIDTPGTLGANTTTDDRFGGVSVGPGQAGTAYNFGERSTGLSGYVFRDDGRDGNRTGDPVLSGVVITLIGGGADGDLNTTGDNTTVTTITDAAGFYRFDNLPAGDYRIIETQPAGYGDSPLTPSTTRTVTLPVAGLSEQNFGETLGSLTGTVYHDRNDNGTFDAGDTPIANVAIVLTGTDSNGTAITRTAFTDASGQYNFPLLFPSNGTGYTLTELQPLPYTDRSTNPGSLGGTATTNATSAILLAAGQVGTVYNFGELLPPNSTFLSGAVYRDDNRDGNRQSGEPGIAGVVVQLLNPDGSIAAVATTDANGNYVFTGLTPGANYSILELQPANYGDSPVGPPRLIPVINLPLGGLTNQNFGEILGSLTGNVFFDANNDGTRQSGEPGIGGTTVVLSGIAADGTTVLRTATTDSNGQYLFGDLPAGTYTVTETQPPLYTDGRDAVGSSGGILANDLLSNIPLSGGQNATQYNFGEIGVPVSGAVFYDANRDGNRGGSETPISGVVVQLVNEFGVVVGNATTDANGNYTFPNVPPGSYTLRELQPSGYGDPLSGPFSANVRPITVVSTPIANQDFGDTLSTLSGMVYVDGNNDGIFQVGEAPISGVRVVLVGTDLSGNAITRTAFTDPSGLYLFADLPAGTFRVSESQPAPYLDGLDTAGSAGGNTSANDIIDLIPVGVSTDVTNNNFGERLPARPFIRGTVYLDQNNDGTRNPGDIGLAGVVVVLRDSQNNPITTTTTDIDGNYVFTGLNVEQSYIVVETQPTLYANGLENPGNSISVPNLLPTGSSNNNFGEIGAAVSGTVYYDRDVSGTQNTGDVPIAGVLVTLTGTDGLGNAVSRTTNTNGAGFYQFTGLAAGSYIVTESQPAGYNQGTNQPGALGGTVSGDAINAIPLPAGGNAPNNLFGEIGTTVSGRVFNDINRDGTPTAGAGIGGVIVILIDGLGNVVATTTTLADGSYLFTGVLPGNYSIVESQPATYGNSPVGPTTNRTIAVPLTGVTDQNFGEILSRLSGSVFVDFNNDGIRQAGEPPIANVAVILTGTDVNGNAITRTATTNPAGLYQFTELPAGNYAVREIQPTVWGDGRDTLGSAGGVATNDLFTAIPLGGGVEATGYDYGEIGGSIAGVVFNDENNNGIQDPTDLGIPGVVVVLTGIDGNGLPVTVTATTTAAGTYLFENLPAGTYTLTERQPANFQDGIDTAGTGGGTVPTPDSDVIRSIPLTPGGRLTDYKFGEFQPSSISGTVYHDINRNQKQDPFEPGIAGAVVILTGVTDRGVGVTLTTTTDASGFYSFGLLRPGTYSLTELQPAGYAQSGNRIGSNGGSLAPVDVIRTINLRPNVNATSYLFGEVVIPAVRTPVTPPPPAPGDPEPPRVPSKGEFLSSTPPVSTAIGLKTSPDYSLLGSIDPTRPSQFFATADEQFVRVFDVTSGAERFRFNPFDGFTGGTRVAVGDVTGDGVQDIVVAAGPGAAPRVVVYDGNTGEMVQSFYAFIENFHGGVFVTLADFNGDGHEDIVVAAGPGGGPHVRVLSGANPAVELASFFAFAPEYFGGTQVASGDINGDGTPDLVIAAGPGGSSHITVRDGNSIRAGGSATLFNDFYAFDPNYQGSISISANDTNGDGFADVVAGSGVGTPGHIVVYSGAGLRVNQYLQIASFYAFDPSSTTGVQVATVDLNGDGQSEIIGVGGLGQRAVVRFYNSATGQIIDQFAANWQGNSKEVYIG